MFQKIEKVKDPLLSLPSPFPRSLKYFVDQIWTFFFFFLRDEWPTAQGGPRILIFEKINLDQISCFSF